MPPTASPGTRAMGGDQRLEMILTTAERLFYEKGYRAISIRDLASAVGIQMSSLYYYFKSKDEILYRIIKRHFAGLIEFTDGVLADLPPDAAAAERLGALVEHSVHFLLEERMGAGVSISHMRDLGPEQTAELTGLLKQYEARFREILDEGMVAGEFTACDTVLASYFVLGALARLNVWYRPAGRLSPGEIAREYRALVLRAVGARDESGRVHHGHQEE